MKKQIKGVKLEREGCTRIGKVLIKYLKRFSLDMCINENQIKTLDANFFDVIIKSTRRRRIKEKKKIMYAQRELKISL